MKKRVISLLLILAMVLSMMPQIVIDANAVESSWLWPTPNCFIVSSNFGWRDLDGDGTLEDLHRGIDIVGSSGTAGQPIVASKSGTVYAYNNSLGDSEFASNSFGNYVILKHDDGMYSIYAHMQKMEL